MDYTNYYLIKYILPYPFVKYLSVSSSSALYFYETGVDEFEFVTHWWLSAVVGEPATKATAKNTNNGGQKYFKKSNTFEKKIENDPVNLLQDLSINL